MIRGKDFTWFSDVGLKKIIKPKGWRDEIEGSKTDKENINFSLGIFSNIISFRYELCCRVHLQRPATNLPCRLLTDLLHHARPQKAFLRTCYRATDPPTT